MNCRPSFLGLFARWFAVLVLTTLCSACLNFAGHMANTRHDLQAQLAEPDPKTQTDLRESWYGRLLDALYVLSIDQGAQPRTQLDRRLSAQLQQNLQEVMDQIDRSAERHSGDAGLLQTLAVPNLQRSIRMVVLPDSDSQVLIVPKCETGSIEISVQAVREIVRVALAQREVSQWEAFAESMMLEFMHIDASANNLMYSGSAIEALFGPPPTRYAAAKLKQHLSAQGTVVWKTLAFVFGHEAHHIWSNKCSRDSDDGVQRQIELRADVLGAILAISAYNQQCDRRITARRSDALAMLGDPAGNVPLPREVEAQMRLVSSPELLAGASGITTLHSALRHLNRTDPSHASQEERQSVDERGARSLSAQLFEQPVKSSWFLSVVGRFADMSKDDMIDHVYSNLVFAPKYRSVDSFLLCVDIAFKDREETFRRF